MRSRVDMAYLLLQTDISRRHPKAIPASPGESPSGLSATVSVELAMTPAQDRHLIENKIQELVQQFREPASCDPVAFLGAQFDAGLAWVHFDKGCGGLGLAAGY